MNKKLKILLLEDSADDVILIEREISRGGISGDFKVVDNEVEYSSALEAFKPDIILCDHTMPTFNSMGALKLHKKYQEDRCVRIPFLLVSGALTDEFAFFCLQAGADDYVLKDRLRRLPGAMRSALQKCKIEKERSSYQEKIESYESNIKEAEQIAHFGTWKAWLGTDVAHWSDGSFRIYGYEPGEATPGFDLFIKHVHPDDLDYVKREIGSVVTSKQGKELEFRIVTKSGEVKYISNRTNIYVESNKNVVLVGLNYDITERKLVEKRVFDMYSTARLGSWEVDLEKSKVSWSDVTRELFEVDADYQPDLKQTFSFYKEGPNRNAIKKASKECRTKGTTWDLELEVVGTRGKVRWVRSIGKCEMREGKCVRLYGSIQDIDEWKRKEFALEQENNSLKQGVRQAAEANDTLTKLVDSLLPADKEQKEILTIVQRSLKALGSVVSGLDVPDQAGT